MSGLSVIFIVPLFVATTQTYVLPFVNVTFGGFGRCSFQVAFALSIFCSAMNLSISPMAASLLFEGGAVVVTGFFSSPRTGVASATARVQAVNARKDRIVMGSVS